MTKTKSITLVGILSALSIVLYLLDFPLFFYFPSYLKLDLSDIPAILAGIAAGPLAGIIVEFVKNVLHFIIKSETGGVGEIANFFAGIGLVIPIALVLRKTKKNSYLPYLLGALSMTIVANVMNYFVTLPLYKIPKEMIWPTIANFLIAFNLIKALVVSVITAVLYRKLKVLIEK